MPHNDRLSRLAAGAVAPRFERLALSQIRGVFHGLHFTPVRGPLPSSEAITKAKGGMVTLEPMAAIGARARIPEATCTAHRFVPLHIQVSACLLWDSFEHETFPAPAKYPTPWNQRTLWSIGIHRSSDDACAVRLNPSFFEDALSAVVGFAVSLAGRVRPNADQARLSPLIFDLASLSVQKDIAARLCEPDEDFPDPAPSGARWAKRLTPEAAP